MKKVLILLSIIVLWSSSIYASEMNSLLEQNFKIVKVETIKFERKAYKVFTLKNGKNIYLCLTQIDRIGGFDRTECIKP